MASGGVLTAEPFDQDTSWSTGLKPTTGDPAIVSHTLGPDTTVTDATGHAATVDLELLQTHPKFHGRFGTSGSPIVGSAGLIQIRGGGGFYFEATANGSGWKTDRVEIACKDVDTEVELGSEAGDAGDWVEIYALRGNVLLKANIAFDTAGKVVVGQVRGPNDVRVEIAQSSEVLPYLKVRAGRATARNPVTNLVIAGGTVWKTDNKAVNVDVLGGILFYDHQAIEADGTTICVHAGGTLHLWNTAAPKRLSTVILLPESRIVFCPHPEVHTFANPLIDLGAKRIVMEAEAADIALRARAA